MSNFTGCLTDQIKLSTDEKILGWVKKKILCRFAFSRLKTKWHGQGTRSSNILLEKELKGFTPKLTWQKIVGKKNTGFPAAWWWWWWFSR